jgi:hypothetical protein
LGTWGADLEKPNFEPKPEFVLKDEGALPSCVHCKHRSRTQKHLECNYCTATFGASTGNYFEPKDEPVVYVSNLSYTVEPIKPVEPVTVEEEVMPIARGNVRIENATQLMRAGGLMQGDTVVFGDIVYSVNDTHLSHFEYENDKIFTALGIDYKDKYKLADTAYGYATHESGIWPVYNCMDLEAATRLVYVLYALCDAKQAEDYAENVEKLQELKAMLESYQQDEDDAAVELADAQRNYDYEKQARVQLEADIELLEKELSK